MSRTEIEQFCRRFLLDHDYQHLQLIITEYDERFAHVNIEFTFENFNSTFQLICKNLFTARPATSAYVLTILGFAMNIDRRLKISYWYKSDDMIALLTDVLVDVHFSPKSMIDYKFCILF